MSQLTEFLKWVFTFFKERLFMFILTTVLFLGITEMETLDFRFKFRGEIPGDPRILLIDIDNQSLSLRPPWNLKQLEKLLVPILQRKPAAIGLDLRFYGDPKNKNYEGNLQQFLESIAGYSIPIVLAAGFPGGQLLKPEIKNRPENVFFGSVTIIDNYYPESDNVVRRVKLLTEDKNEEEPIPAFALQLLSVARNLTPWQCLSELAAAGLKKSPENYHLIRYYNNYRFSDTRVYEKNTAVEKFKILQAKKMLAQPYTTEFESELEQHIQDSTIVVVGATYETPGISNDWFQTPLSSKPIVSGLIVHANILSWLLGKTYIAEPGCFSYVFITFILLLITWVGIHFIKSNRAILVITAIFFLSSLVYSLIAIFSFNIWEIWLPMVWPLRIALVCFFILSIKKITNFKIKKWLKIMKSNYILLTTIYLLSLTLTPVLFAQVDELQRANELNKQVFQLYQQGQYEKAISIAQEELRLREQALSPDHLDVATSLNNLAVLYNSMGSYRETEPLFLRALKIREEQLGSDHPEVATSLNNLAELYRSMDSYSAAEPMYQRALKIQEEQLGPDHPDVATSLNNLAALYDDMGSYSEAELLYQRALKIKEEKLGPDHPDVATSLNNLAALYQSMGSYREAESLYQRALKIDEKVLGPAHPSVATDLNNLALLYFSMGSYREAEPLYQRALKILKEQLDPDHPYVAASLSGLAALYESIGSYREAESLHQRALKIKEEKLGPDHPDVATSLNNLAALYYSMGSYSEAESLHQRALKISEEKLGPDHPDVATSLNNLAALYQSMGSYSKAESLYQRTLKIREKKLGLDHPDVATSLSNIISLWGSTANFEKIFHNAKRLILLEFHHYHTMLPYLSEKRQLDYVRKNSPLPLLWPSLYVQYGKKYSKFQSLTSEVLLNQKGIVYEILTTRKRQLKPGPKNSKSLLDSLNTIRAQLANAYFGEPSNPEQLMPFIQSLLAQQERLESKFAREGYEVKTQKTPIPPSQLCRSLPEDYTLLDFWYFQRYIFKGENRGWGNYHYLAVIYQAKCEPEIIHLGEADSINKSIFELRQAIFTNTLNKTQTKQNNIEAEQLVKTKGKKLYQQLFKPLLPAMGHPQKVIICADGQLHYLPFGVLVDEQNHYLVESYLFHYVSTSRDILNWDKKKQPSNQNALIMAKSKFQQKNQELKHTVAEAMAIDSLLHTNNFSTMLKLDDQATESVLKSVKSPQILHISTHGFFKPAPAAPRPAGEIRPASFQTTIRRGLVENPLLRSGLILTGTNQTESTQTNDDGTTTALEIVGLDLAETDLVTLSACVTGIGDLKSGEGLYGLHRSFLLAGAKTVLASLWSVSDLETKDLMVEFYRRYLSEGNTAGKTEALRQAQLTVIKNLREKYGAAPPAYWGAFVCIGEM